MLLYHANSSLLCRQEPVHPVDVSVVPIAPPRKMEVRGCRYLKVIAMQLLVWIVFVVSVPFAPVASNLHIIINVHANKSWYMPGTGCSGVRKEDNDTKM